MKYATKEKNIVLFPASLTKEAYYEILFSQASIDLSEDVLQKAFQSFEFLTAFSEGKVIYGVNTGFGPMAPYQIPAAQQKALQFNLIRSHSSGLGQALSALEGRAILLARLNSLAIGMSAIHPNCLQLMVELLNRNIAPVIYEHGGVGASGDLVQLAHVALTLIGEGKVWYEDQIQDTKQVFQKLGLKPISIYLREGLALINGTSGMTGLAMLNVHHAQRQLQWALFFGAGLQELVKAYSDGFSGPLNQSKKHHGQQFIAQQIQHWLEGSTRIRDRYKNTLSTQNGKLADKVQEYYSIRCLPQILGPIYDCLTNCTATVVQEINSVNDNPVTDVESQNVYHGGNFHGDYISFEMDKLKIAFAKLGLLLDRQLNYLLNDRLNEILPPFINAGILGLNFGMQGMQFTATSSAAENQTLASPMSIHSIPTNNDNQDIVSMGFNAALLTKRVLENNYDVLSICLAAFCHAVRYLQLEDSMAGRLNDTFKQIAPFVVVSDQDTASYEMLTKLKQYIKENPPSV